MIGKILLGLTLVLFGFTQAHGGVIGKEVTYRTGDVDLKGYIAHDDSIGGKRPGIVVVHEWWGHNEYARKRAEMLAKAGYVALAVDMYGNGRQADHPDQAAKFSAEVKENLPMARQRFMAGVEILKEHSLTDPQKTGAIGYCFGGGVVLAMAREGVDLTGVVSFHGDLSAKEPAKPGEVKAAILVETGGADKFVPLTAVVGFVKEMSEAEADFIVHSLPGAMHSFTNPDADRLGKKFSLPLAYNEQADHESWQEMLDFFERNFAR